MLAAPQLLALEVRDKSLDCLIDALQARLRAAQGRSSTAIESLVCVLGRRWLRRQQLRHGLEIVLGDTGALDHVGKALRGDGGLEAVDVPLQARDDPLLERIGERGHVKAVLLEQHFAEVLGSVIEHADRLGHARRVSDARIGAIEPLLQHVLHGGERAVELLPLDRIFRAHEWLDVLAHVAEAPRGQALLQRLVEAGAAKVESL
eukprot:scaffold42343_cov75-Phaeocystis_antarctica.AAC.2